MKNNDFLKRYKPANHSIEGLIKKQHNPPKSKIKMLCWMDSPIANTGFGVVARNVLTRLHKTGKYEIECLGINHFGDFLDIDQFPFQIVPARLGDPKDPYGLNMFLRVLDKREYDIVFIMNDTFVVEQVSSQLKKLRAAKLAQHGRVFKLVYYYPIDCRAIPGATSLIEMADKAVAYSDFAIDETKKIIKRDDIERIYLGVNTDIFKPLEPEEREFFRKKYFNVSDDTYIFINVNRNSPRKDVAKSIFAFSEFRKEIPKSILYLHMAVKDAGAGTMTPIDLSVPVQHLNLGDNGAVRFPSNFFPATGVPEKDLRSLYCSVDAFITSDNGEGMGLTRLEAMACGIPIIVPDNTVTPELFGEDGDKAYIYPCKEHILIDSSGYRKTGRIDDILNSMLTCYAERNNPRQHSMLARAREFAVSLHWDNIAKQWDDLLDKMMTEQPTISNAKILTGGVEL